MVEYVNLALKSSEKVMEGVPSTLMKIYYDIAEYNQCLNLENTEYYSVVGTMFLLERVSTYIMGMNETVLKYINDITE